MQKRSPTYKLGVFVIVGIAALGVLALIFAGGHIDRTSMAAYTLFGESVQGLEIGSPVKFRGVTVGRVDEIRILNADLRVLVIMDLYPDAVGLESPEQLRRFIHGSIEDKAACRLDWTGITGAKYIEFDIFADVSDDKRSGALPASPVGDAVFIPSVEGPLSGIVKDMGDVFVNLAEVNWKGLEAKLTESLQKADRFLEHEDLQNALVEITTAARSVSGVAGKINQQVGEDDLTSILAEYRELAGTARTNIDKLEMERLRRDIDDFLASYKGVPGDVRDGVGQLKDTGDRIEAFIVKLDERLDEMELAATAESARQTMAAGRETLGKADAKLEAAGETLAGARGTLEEAQRTLAELRAARADLTAALDQLTRTLDAYERFARVVEEDPSSLLRGKSKTEARMVPE